MPVTAALLELNPRSTELQALVNAAAARLGVPPRALLLDALLQLPRLADERGLVELDEARTHLNALASHLNGVIAPYRAWAGPPPRPVRGVRDVSLEPVPQEVARVVLERFHYLRSFRHDSEHLGAMRDGRPAALLSLSPFDLETLQAALPSDLDPSEVVVLSRVFAFDWMPANTLSFLLSKLTRAARRRERAVRLLVTYVNPNLGFAGASYRAANWLHLAREHGTRYAYLDGRYVTDRELAREFGTGQPSRLHDVVRGRVTFTRMPLRPLELYAYPVDRRLRRLLETRRPVRVARPTP